MKHITAGQEAGMKASQQQHEAYCLECMGGGKSLGIFTSRKGANVAATGHGNAYGHNVTILSR